MKGSGLFTGSLPHSHRKLSVTACSSPKSAAHQAQHGAAAGGRCAAFPSVSVTLPPGQRQKAQRRGIKRGKV